MEHWILCDDCTVPIRRCLCGRAEDHHVVRMPHPNWKKPRIFPTLCSDCQFHRDQQRAGYKV